MWGFDRASAFVTIDIVIDIVIGCELQRWPLVNVHKKKKANIQQLVHS